MAKEDFLFLENPMPGQVLRKFSTENPKGKKNSNDSYDSPQPENPTTLLDDADLITSETVGDNNNHKPVLDIDFEAKLIESSTPGHYHLYLDKEISWYKYKKLLNALVYAGIIEPGFAQASINRGYSAVRLPWIDKPIDEKSKEHNYDKLEKELVEPNPFTDEPLPKVKKLKGSDAYPFPFAPPTLPVADTDELLT